MRLARLSLAVVVAACGSGKPAPASPPPDPLVTSDAAVATTSDAAVATPTPDGTTKCAGPPPTPDHRCVEGCGPPVVREGDPPPAWHWLSPDEVRRRNQFGCPRCLAATTQIATPSGPRAIADLAIGDPIITVDAAGARIPARVVHVGSTPIAGAHHLVRLTLSDGRVVAGSAGHPDALGRPLAAIRINDELDGARVVRVQDVRLSGDRTWDVLPSGPTGLYVADDVVLRSTFFRAR